MISVVPSRICGAVLHVPPKGPSRDSLENRVRKVVGNSLPFALAKELRGGLLRNAILQTLPKIPEAVAGIIASYHSFGLEDSDFPPLFTSNLFIKELFFNGNDREVIIDGNYIFGCWQTPSRDASFFFSYEQENHEPLWVMNLESAKYRSTGKGLLLLDPDQTRKLRWVDNYTGRVTHINLPFPCRQLHITQDDFCCFITDQGELVRGEIKNGKFIQQS